MSYRRRPMGQEPPPPKNNAWLGPVVGIGIVVGFLALVAKSSPKVRPLY